MKTFLFSIVLLLQSYTLLTSQSWFTGDPHWTNHFTGGMGGSGIEYVHITGDTVLNGKSVKIFNKRMIWDGGQEGYHINRFVYQSGDTIWTWQYNKFVILYNFSLLPGDTLSWGIYTGQQLHFVVDSIGVTDVSGLLLRFQKVRCVAPSLSLVFKSTIIERIGMVNGMCEQHQTIYPCTDQFFFDESSHTSLDYPSWQFCHYTSDSFVLEDPAGNCPPVSPACDILVQIIQSGHCNLPKIISTGQILYPCHAPDSFLNLAVGSLAKISYYGTYCATNCQPDNRVVILCYKEVSNSIQNIRNASPEVRLYPNPASGDVFIENFAPEKIVIIDVRGSIVKQMTGTSFSIMGLPTGYYFVKLSDEERVWVKKLQVE